MFHNEVLQKLKEIKDTPNGKKALTACSMRGIKRSHQVGDLLGIKSKSQRVVDQLGITSIQILNLSQRYFILQ